MARLSFNRKEVEQLVADIENAKKYRLTYTQRYESDLYCLKNNVERRTDNLPYKDEEIDFSKVEPSFWIVKDHGVYLMGNGTSKELKENEKRPVVYAKGYNPDKDTDWWDYAYMDLGGDDFVIDIPIDWFKSLLKRKPNAKVFAINIGATQISLAN